jgi:selenocysteine lyase/cysteine desulfurase
MGQTSAPPQNHLGSQHYALREQFPLRPDVIFLNHGSFGACPRPVFEAYQAWQLELEREPVEFLGRRFRDLMGHAREVLAAYVGAAPDELVYVPNATTGLNIVARSLPLQPGDQLLATDHEYGALDRTWRFVCQRRGARCINQPLPLPPCDAAALQRRLYDEHHVEVPIIEWGGRQFVRVPIQGYNSQDDVEALIGALRALLGDVKVPGRS